MESRFSKLRGCHQTVPSASASGDADGGRLVAFTVDRGLVPAVGGDRWGRGASGSRDDRHRSGHGGSVSLRRYQAGLNQEATDNIYPPASPRPRQPPPRRPRRRRLIPQGQPRRRPKRRRARKAPPSRAAAPAHRAARRKRNSPSYNHWAPDEAAALEAGEFSSPLLRTLRHSLGLSQAAAAQSLGVSRGLVADAERGRRAGQQTPHPFDRWSAPRARRMRRGRAEESRVGLGRYSGPSCRRPVRHSRAGGNPCSRLLSPAAAGGPRGRWTRNSRASADRR